MKLFFDQHFSFKLIGALKDLYPHSSQARVDGLDEADDPVIWEHALRNGYTIVTKDSDYVDLSLQRGHPPKVIILLIGNSTTDQVEALFRRHTDRISQFELNESEGVLELR